MKNIISLLFKSGIGISKEEYLYASSLNLIINIVFFLSFLMLLEAWNLIFATIVLVIMIIVPAGYISSNLRIKRLHDLWYTKNTFNFWFRFFWLTANFIFFLDDWKQKNNIKISFFMWIIIAFVSIVLFYILIMKIIKDLSILNNYFVLIRQTIGI